MHHPPPVELVLDQVDRVVKREQEQQRETQQTGQQHQVDHGLASPEDGHADVVEKAQRHHHDADLGDGGLLQELAAHGRQQFIAGQLREAGVGHQQVAQYGQRPGDQKDPEQRQRQHRAVQFAFGFLRHQEIGGSHEAEQQPDDQQVGVHHARDVEGDLRKQEIPPHVLQAHHQAEQDLADEQADGGDEIGFCDGL